MAERKVSTASVAINGGKIRRLRKERGLEVAELAGLVGCGRPYIAKIELGHSKRVSAATFARLCDALAIPSDVRWQLFDESELVTPGLVA